MATRGEHLLKADRVFATGGGLLGRLAAPAFARVLEQLDVRLREGGIHATLPSGERRRIGFHAPGPEPVVELRSWLALVRLATSGSVGWYKAWERGEWASPDPVPLFDLFMRNAASLGDAARAKGPPRWVNRLAHLARDNAPRRARENIAAHYDLGNDFYAAWLDPSMTYSSAVFAPGEDLQAAQSRKIALLLDRLQLKPGDRLLEIGCGWGSLAIAAAERGAQVVGLTLSGEQKAWAERRIAEQGLSDRIDIRLADYRDIRERFDAVASVEMVEAVGERWWGAYLDRIAGALSPGGRAALQFISIRPELFDRYAASADFIQTYIFPGGMLLHEPRFAAMARQRGLSWEDRDGFGLDYAETLRLWRERYDAAVGRGALAGFDGRFHRLWRYYLMYCEGGFRGQGIDVAQVTLVKR
ncbi:MAG: Cyclopropane-fatty-acyl-phospholipid synthase [uncultured Sphingomonas sp.]|uniref:Cyclopropane-fatty-acyl-phospholipid synthase n=1 Tax=uncultured Sphingomonas sp. TaxID=158754 RepID=A0A6J4T6W9_9SPHN|nr:cyclopropane-fatty-acyl-phospholipid synthase family protein [uncultured Sphingomonas sp.]CAA9514865.1 MAG: Cyclopropane-fatty-acyl-phospholipid synthase [uncultured Sphingomonas sp.]